MRIYPTLILLFILCTPSVYADIRSIGEALKQAAALESGDHPKEALELYRKLYARYPRRADILFRLESLLSRTGQHSEAVDLLEARLKRAPHDITARLRMGDALYALEKKESAFKHWDRVPEGATQSGPYILAADRYRKRNLHARAAALYRKGRRALGNPTLFARELAELAERQTDYPEAVREYLLFLQDKPQRRPFVESRLREFAREADQKAPVFDFLGDQVRKQPNDPALSWLLVEYALPAGYAGAALQVLVKQTNDTRGRHSLLLRIASFCLEGGAYPTAAVAYGALLDRAKAPDVRSRALLGLARTQEGHNRVDEARRLYRDLIDRHPRLPEAGEAHYRLGLLLRETDPQGALQTFQDLVGAGRRTSWRYRALFEISELHLRGDRFAQAEAACNLVSRERRGHEEAGEARYRIGELRFLAGDFDTARILLEALLSGPAIRYAINDALALSVLIQEGSKEGPGLLKAYAAARKQVRQKKAEPALTAFRDLLQNHPDSGLTDRILADRAELEEALERYPEAVQTCRRLIADRPWSPLCPWAQMALGRIFEDRLGQVVDARSAYETLLVDYPESLEADAARDRLRALQKKIQELDTRQKETG